MGSPPSPDTAPIVPPFTPAHHLKDRLLSFTDFLLCSVETWSNPHPLWPPPPAPLSFSGSDRFIKGRLPHRTAAIAASLSSIFSDTAPLPDACKHGDGHDHMEVDSLSNIQDVTHSGNDVATAAANRHGGSTTPANAHSGNPELRSNLSLLHPQADDSAQDSQVNDTQDIRSNDMINVSTVVRLDDNDCAHLQNADSIRILPSHETSGALDGSPETMLSVDGHSVGLRKVVETERLMNTQPNGFSAKDAADKGLQNVSVEVPVDSQLNEQVDELEEGELSERFPDDELPSSMDEGNVDGEAGIRKGSPFDANTLKADIHRDSPSDAYDKRVVESETDDEMNEPISSFVSRRRTKSLLKLAIENLSSPDTSEPMKQRNSKKERKSKEEQEVLEKALHASWGSNGKPEHVKVLQQGLSRVAIATDVNEVPRSLGLQIGSTQVVISDSINSGRMEGAMRTSSKGLLHQGYAETGQPEGGKVCKDVDVGNDTSLFCLVSLRLMAFPDFTLVSSLHESK